MDSQAQQWLVRPSVLWTRYWLHQVRGKTWSRSRVQNENQHLLVKLLYIKRRGEIKKSDGESGRPRVCHTLSLLRPLVANTQPQRLVLIGHTHTDPGPLWVHLFVVLLYLSVNHHCVIGLFCIDHEVEVRNSLLTSPHLLCPAEEHVGGPH